MRDYYSIQYVADFFAVSYQRVYYWIKSGKLEVSHDPACNCNYVGDGPRHYAISGDAVVRFLSIPENMDLLY